MITTMPDIELKAELQELIEITNNWISDVGYFSQDLKSLKRILASLQGQPGRLANVDFTSIYSMIERLEQENAWIEKDLCAFYYTLNSLFKKPSQTFHLTLIETQFELEGRMAQLLRSYGILKNQVFSFRASKTSEEGNYKLQSNERWI